MAITNLITGELLDEELQQNQQKSLPDDPTSEQEQDPTFEQPEETKPKAGRRKKPEPEPGIPPHTTLYLIETLQNNLDRMKQLNDQTEKLLARQNKEWSRIREETAINPNHTSDPGLNAGEIAAEFSRLFDDGCKKIVEQRLSDALKQSDRISDRLSRRAKQADGIRRLLVGALILSGVNFAALAAVLITLWLH